MGLSVLLTIECPIFDSYFFRFEAKRSETETVLLRFAKLTNAFFASFRFLSLHFFRIVLHHVFKHRFFTSFRFVFSLAITGDQSDVNELGM